MGCVRSLESWEHLAFVLYEGSGGFDDSCITCKPNNKLMLPESSYENKEDLEKVISLYIEMRLISELFDTENG